MSLLPIDASTQKYGSSDGGERVMKDEKIHVALQAVTSRLNLKEHLAGTKSPQWISTATDIEVHRGKDNKFYILGTSPTPAMYT